MNEEKNLNDRPKNFLTSSTTKTQWNDMFFEINLAPRSGNIHAAYNRLHRKINKTNLDQRILNLTNFADFFGNHKKTVVLMDTIEIKEEIKSEENEENFPQMSLSEHKFDLTMNNMFSPLQINEKEDLKK